MDDDDRNLVRHIVTAVVAVLLALLPLFTGGTKLAVLGLPFYAPGFFAAAIVFPTGVNSASPVGFLILAFLLNAIFVWAVLIAALKLIERIQKRKEQG
ncbi:MAG TPA: hypothetical protein VF392_08195 [Terracidiphilus sp.]